MKNNNQDLFSLILKIRNTKLDDVNRVSSIDFANDVTHIQTSAGFFP